MRRREADLRGALDNPDDTNEPAAPAGAGTVPPGNAKKAEEKPFDYQLQRALDMIAGIALYNARVSN